MQRKPITIDLYSTNIGIVDKRNYELIPQVPYPIFSVAASPEEND